jgi:BASS family bile acid:Na+ symporter
MLAFLAGVAVPALAFFLMLFVGLDLRCADFFRSARYPRTVAIATLGQVLLLPLLAIALVRVVSPNEKLSVGVLLLAFSPGGAISNYYTHLAGRNVALSVTLTAISTVCSLITIPISALVYLGWMGLTSSRVVVPITTILLQLSVFVLLPIGLGM